MKSKKFVPDKIKAILMKRYALEKILSFWELFCVVVLSTISFMFFSLFWFIVCLYKEKGDIYEYAVSVFNIIALAVILGSGYFIWRIIKDLIPKFMFIGLLGWFLIGAGLLSSILVPGTIVTNGTDTKSIQIPAGRFSGLNEKEPNRLDAFSPERLSIKKLISMKKLNKLIDIFLAPSDFRIEREINKEKDLPGFFKNDVFKSVRSIIFLIFLLLLFDLFFTVTMFKKFKKPGKKYRFSYFNLPWNKREQCVTIKAFIVLLLAVALFFLTMNYFFILLVTLVLFNGLLIKWEILSRGQNHKINTRTVLFIFLMLFFALTAGEAFFLIYLPVFIFIKEGAQILSLYDAVLINWIVLVGSLASILMGLTTQVVWSGQRLTEKFK